MPESISLKSKIWDYFIPYNDSLTVVKDSNGRPLYFALEENSNLNALKHSSVPKVMLDEAVNVYISGLNENELTYIRYYWYYFDENDFIKCYPPMLPNSLNLDLSYASECKVNPAPIYWTK